MRQLVFVMVVAPCIAACGGGQTAQRGALEGQAANTPGAAAGASVHTPTAAEGSSGAASNEGVGGPPAAEGSSGSASNEFVLRTLNAKTDAQHHAKSSLKPTASEAAMRFTVVDKDKGPIPGILIAMTAVDGKKYYTEETDAEGYAEVLVPVGKKYELVYLSLGRKDVAATVTVTDEPNQNVRLTLRYKRLDPVRPKAAAGPAPAPGLVLSGVTFDTGKATIRPESYPQLDMVVEYLMHKTNARIEISGHTDNVGNPKANKTLSNKRAQACREYVVSKGIDGSRVEAVGYGDERPIASNDNEAGRQQNRRIEAVEL